MFKICFSSFIWRAFSSIRLNSCGSFLAVLFFFAKLACEFLFDTFFLFRILVARFLDFFVIYNVCFSYSTKCITEAYGDFTFLCRLQRSPSNIIIIWDNCPSGCTGANNILLSPAPHHLFRVKYSYITCYILLGSTELALANEVQSVYLKIRFFKLLQKSLYLLESFSIFCSLNNSVVFRSVMITRHHRPLERRISPTINIFYYSTS